MKRYTLTISILVLSGILAFLVAANVIFYRATEYAVLTAENVAQSPQAVEVSQQALEYALAEQTYIAEQRHIAERAAEIEAEQLCAEDLEVLMRVVAAESRGECLEGQMAVAQTIKDRGDLWNKDYVEVATAPYQFAEQYTGELSDSVKQAVNAVFVDGERVTDEAITHFYAHTLIDAPYWTENKTLVCKIGCHSFYR